MPYVPPNTLEDVPKKYRAKLKAAMLERAVLAYSFSWAKLFKLMRVNLPHLENSEIADMLRSCVAGFSDDETKSAREAVNEDILTELTTLGIKTLRQDDPFGRPKDFLIMEGTSTSFLKQVAMDILVTECKVPAKAIAEIWERSTKRTPFTTVQARDVKEKPEE